MALELSLLYPANYDRSKEEAFKDYDFVDSLMENKENGTRSYKISRSTPDGLSYARNYI